MMKQTAAAALVTGLLAGCAAVPEAAPKVEPLKTETLGLTGTSVAVIVEKWWTTFGDPQLDRLIDQALDGSPTLAAALARLRLAQAAVSSSRAANYPQITFDAQEQRDRLSANYIIPPPLGGSTQWIGTVQANLAWSLDLFGKQDAEIAKARAAAGAAQRDAAAARLALAGAVTQAYVALARAHVLTDMAQDAVNQRQRLATLIAARARTGLENSANAKVAEAQAAGAQVELMRSAALEDVAVHQIAALIGRGADAYAITRPKLDENAISLPDTLPADLLARRADVAAALARIDAATAGREQARRAFYPDINLVGSAGWAAIGLGPLFTGSALQYGAGPAIHLPIFDAGSLRARYAGSTAQLDLAVTDYNATVVHAVRDAADALTELRSLRDQAGELAHMRAAADDSYRLAEQRYKSGLSPQITLLNAEDIVLQARQRGAALSTDIVAARVALIMALGGGFTNAERPQGQLP